MICAASLFERWQSSLGACLVAAFQGLDAIACAADDSGSTATVVLCYAGPKTTVLSWPQLEYIHAIGISRVFGLLYVVFPFFKQPSLYRLHPRPGPQLVHQEEPAELFACCANVGDSHAFLYTGSAVLRLNADHRLDANKAECARCRAAGGTIGTHFRSCKHFTSSCFFFLHVPGLDCTDTRANFHPVSTCVRAQLQTPKKPRRSRAARGSGPAG